MLELLALRFEFVARDSIFFPPFKAANVLRGALGMLLVNEQYARVFAPVRKASGPSGLQDPPRPFVFRARHLDGVTVAPEAGFGFTVNLFLTEKAVVAALVDAFQKLALEGLGPGRGRAELLRVSGDDVPLLVGIEEPSPRTRKIRVDFLSPTELKHDGRIVSRPEFPILFARIRDRVSTLRHLYGPGALEIDFTSLRERAGKIRMTKCDLKPVEAERHSSRTGQTHPLGGLIGTAEYEGNLAEFLPYLEAASYTGVGRQAVWGKGETRSTPG